MSRFFDADSDALLSNQDIFKCKSKEYIISDISMEAMIKIEKLEAESKGGKFDALVDQIFLILKKDNEVTRGEIMNWGLKTCLAFTAWLFEPMQEANLKKTLESLKTQRQESGKSSHK